MIEENWYAEVADIGYTELNTILVSYDAANRITAIEDDYSDYAYTYDALDRMLTITIDNPGAPTVVLTNEYGRLDNLRTELAAARKNGRAKMGPSKNC